MSSGLRSEIITAHTDYVPAASKHAESLGFTRARLFWSDHTETIADRHYTLDIDPYVSLELDKHLTVHPSGVRLYDKYTDSSLTKLATLVGADLTEALQQTRNVGFTVVSFSLSEENRHNIARLQAASPSTREEVRGLCVAMLASEQALNPVITPGHPAQSPQQRSHRFRHLSPRSAQQAA